MACEYEKKYNDLKEAYEKLEKDKIWEHYIPVSKIEDKISDLEEEYELLLEHQSGKESKYTIKNQHYRQALQELLKENGENENV